jgi:hypothetical protein
MMRYTPNDKYTIAWFKLAECVSKGEKEKAFGVYRLLMHSIEDQAYAYQLEGDLLSAFDDDRASEKYAHAAHLYHHNKRYKEAATLYKSLFFAAVHKKNYLIALIDVYKTHKSGDELACKLISVVDELIIRNLSVYTSEIINELHGIASLEVVTNAYIKTINDVITHHVDAHESIELLLQQALHFLIQQGEQNQLNRLLAVVEQLDMHWYQKACAYLQQN